MLFYRWIRIKRVMSELWDPNDVSLGAGKCALEYIYYKLCDDRSTYDAFLSVLCIRGEDEWQKAASRWHKAIERYVSSLDLDMRGKRSLLLQIEEILTGSRLRLE